MIELTNGQLEGKQKARAWYNSLDRKQIFEIAGYAGTGKTTMVSSLIEELGLGNENVKFATYTGKAALVLTLKGCPTTTIHKLIYDCERKEVPVKDDDGNEIFDEETGNPVTEEKMVFSKKPELDSSIKLIVLDECSMIEQEMLNDILSYDIPIIVLGDKGQLPPIKGSPVLLNNPDVELTEVMRQKEGDPIVHLATLARTHQNILLGDYGKSHVISKKDLDNDIEFGLNSMDRILTNSDIVLCRTNRTRNALNKHIREDIYDIHKKLPTLNDKLICRRNNWQLALTEEFDLNLVNGLIGYVNSPITAEAIKMDISTFYMDFKPEVCNEDFFVNIPASTIPFIDATDKQKKIFEGRQWRYFKDRNVKCNLFEYAYAITVHLSQGSSWRRVFIYDERYGDDYYNSLYTAITRAEKQVILAK